MNKINNGVKGTVAAIVLAGAGTLGTVAYADGHGHMAVPSEIAVPEGHMISLETSAVGTVAWECANDDMMKAKWKFAGPAAVLSDSEGKPAVSYYGPPATWEAFDGSKVTGKQLATAPAGEGNIPFQLVQANPAEGMGVLSGVTYIQRVNLKGGAAPGSGCSADKLGHKALVAYSGDYIFWKAK